MGRNHGIDDLSENDELIPEDDFEYEKKLAEEEREKRAEEQDRFRRREEELKNREKEKQRERDKKIAQDKIELMKLKTGVIDESEEIKEEHTEERKLKGFEKIANIWYHDKIWICFGIFIAAVVIFLIVDTVTREKADITVMLIADNGLSLHTDELSELMEKYTPDINGDGKVHVAVMNVPLNDRSTDTMYSTNSSKFFANLQQGQIIMVITDSDTDPEYQQLMADDLPEQFPDNPYVDEKGLSLNFGFLARELNYDDMPNDIHLCLRRPVTTLDDSLEEMQENYDVNFEIFKAMADSLAEQAELTDDKGLETEPAGLADSSSSVSEADSMAESGKGKEE